MLFHINVSDPVSNQYTFVLLMFKSKYKRLVRQLREIISFSKTKSPVVNFDQKQIFVPLLILLFHQSILYSAPYVHIKRNDYS